MLGMANDLESIAHKEIFGMPLWVWAIGGAAGYYLASRLNQSSSQPPATTTILTGGNSSDSANSCPQIQVPQCGNGQVVVYSTDSNGCPVASCQAASGSPGNPSMTLTTRNRVPGGSWDNTYNGVPVRPRPDPNGIVAILPFDSVVETTGPAVTGAINTGPNSSSTTWYPVAGGYLSAVDVQ
jgi:hypothetical protein